MTRLRVDIVADWELLSEDGDTVASYVVQARLKLAGSDGPCSSPALEHGPGQLVLLASKTN